MTKPHLRLNFLLQAVLGLRRDDPTAAGGPWLCHPSKASPRGQGLSHPVHYKHLPHVCKMTTQLVWHGAHTTWEFYLPCTYSSNLFDETLNSAWPRSRMEYSQVLGYRFPRLLLDSFLVVTVTSMAVLNYHYKTPYALHYILNKCPKSIHHILTLSLK